MSLLRFRFIATKVLSCARMAVYMLIEVVDSALGIISFYPEYFICRVVWRHICVLHKLFWSCLSTLFYIIFLVKSQTSSHREELNCLVPCWLQRVNNLHQISYQILKIEICITQISCLFTCGMQFEYALIYSDYICVLGFQLLIETPWPKN